MNQVVITLKNGEVYTVDAEVWGSFLYHKGISNLDVESVKKA